jgi:hypothetical protein
MRAHHHDARAPLSLDVDERDPHVRYVHPIRVM